MKEFLISDEENGLRLDRWLLSKYKRISRNLLYKLIRDKSVKINEKQACCYTKLKPGDKILLRVCLESEIPEESFIISDEQKRLIEDSIIFSDDSILVLNKPHGIAVQGGTKQLQHLDQMIRLIDKNAGLTHRLDKDTSGALLMGRGRSNRKFLTLAFKERRIGKIYWGLVYPAPSKAYGTLVDYVKDSKISITKYTLIEERKGFGWMEFYPLTGRNHQIRKHCFNNGFSLIGDLKYRNKLFRSKKLHLHACQITFPHPKNDSHYTAQMPLPVHMIESWESLSFSNSKINSSCVKRLE